MHPLKRCRNFLREDRYAQSLNVDSNDHNTIQEARQVAQAAKREAFDAAIEAATAAEEAALEVGKIRNQAMRLQLGVMDLVTRQAQGEDRSEQIMEVTEEMKANIALDEGKEAGWEL
ncbi:hypothetical protein CC78DRAFT_622304 [Lojkania enalia]|uniref:Uncharacterized protein n=1 Tax=Lojkania enalia TaxID=147567 RepID=A0A9P4K1M1_9PLEO|nr:hypothetical protein CC78DRAFT_622304 [Didymosphaeria enalia]